MKTNHEAAHAAGGLSAVFPRVSVLLTVVVAIAGGATLLNSESQASVLIILAVFVGLLILADQTNFGRHVTRLCVENSRFATCTAFVGIFVVIGFFHQEHYALLMVATVALFATACIGLNLQMAFAGIPNFAGAAFFSVGAYTAAILSSVEQIPFVVTIIAGGLGSGLFGAVLLLPVLRTKGHYAALVTIAFGLLLRTWLEVNDTLGGPQGMKIRGASLLGVDFNNVTTIGPWDVSFYLPYALCAAGLFILAFVAVQRLERSWIGIALDVVRTDEIAASVFGVSIARWKILAFVVGNVIIGAAGALYGMMGGFVTPANADISQSLLMLSVVVLGGLGNLWGSLLAAVVIVIVPEKLQAIQEYRLLLFSALVLAILLFRPSGILARPLRNLGRHTALVLRS